MVLSAWLPRPPLAASAAEAAQQQREALRFIAEHCKALQGRAGRRAGVADGERRAKRGALVRQGEALLAGLAQRQPGKHSFEGYGTSVEMRRGSQATGHQAGGQVGGHSPGGNVSPTQLGWRQGDHNRGQGHISGDASRPWGKHFPYIILVPVGGASVFTPLDAGEAEAGRCHIGAVSASRKPGLGETYPPHMAGRWAGSIAWGMSPAAGAVTGWGVCSVVCERGGYVSSTQSIRG